MKTLVIHPKDRSTDFLKPIYENIPDKTVITGDYPPTMNIDEVNELIKSHDRVIMLGHGCPDGLFSMGLFKNAYGLIIDNETTDLLMEKKDNIYVWCNADRFVRPRNLQGFFSGMFVSEVGESWYCNIPSKRDVVDESNNRFAEILGKYVNEPTDVIHEKVTQEYGELAKTNKVAGYNNDRLYYYNNDVVVST